MTNPPDQGNTVDAILAKSPPLSLDIPEGTSFEHWLALGKHLALVDNRPENWPPPRPALQQARAPWRQMAGCRLQMFPFGRRIHDRSGILPVSVRSELV